MCSTCFPLVHLNKNTIVFRKELSSLLKNHSSCHGALSDIQLLPVCILVRVNNVQVKWIHKCVCEALQARLQEGKHGGDRWHFQQHCDNFHLHVVQSMALMQFHTDLKARCGVSVRRVWRCTRRLATNVAVNKKQGRLRPPVSNHCEANTNQINSALRECIHLCLFGWKDSAFI